jgi:N-acetylglucosaminyldiphosphoundecaprenol N-acetyl-beta-D-mannosaminyltransferase
MASIPYIATESELLSEQDGGALFEGNAVDSFKRSDSSGIAELNPTSRIQILDASIDLLTETDLNRILGEEIDAGRKSILANHNLHSLFLYHRQPEFRQFFKAAKYIHADGMSILLLAKLLGKPFKRECRTGYLEWLPSMMEEASSKNWKIFYLGSRPEVWDTAIRILRERWPNLQIAGHHGYFDKSPGHEDGKRILAQMEEFSPNILLVGMGMPIQEKWMLDNFKSINTNMLLACGAMMDYVAGAIPSPPVWIGRWGFEWLFRLCSEPTRLWKRYLVEPILLFPVIYSSVMRAHGFPAEEPAPLK